MQGGVANSSEGTKPGFGFECFKTFRLFQGKQKKLESQVACFESFFSRNILGKRSLIA